MTVLFFLAAAAAAPPPFAPMDLGALDQAIERCDRDTVLPVFNGEGQRRSAFVTAAYQEQADISALRMMIAVKRRAIREAGEAKTAPKPPESDQELALQQLALDDRQRALDDSRRLEQMRQDAIEVKRQYFLTHCMSGRKKND